MLPNNGKLGGSGSGAQQPNDGKQPATHQGSGKVKNLVGFKKAKPMGSLDQDMMLGRMGVSYMHNPAFKDGHEHPTNDHDGDDHIAAHNHMDNAKKAKTTDEKRAHVFRSLNSLNRAKRKGR